MTEAGLEQIKERVSDLLSQKQPVLLAVDGYGGAGKSTFAAKLQAEFPSSIVIGLDDFAVSEQILADRQRFLEQVLVPLSQGKQAKYQKFNWQKQMLDEWVTVEPEGLVILEGVSLLADDFNSHYDLRVWIDTPHEVASQRGMDRDKNVYKVDHNDLWNRIWIPREKEYAKTEPWKRADFVIKV